MSAAAEIVCVAVGRVLLPDGNIEVTDIQFEEGLISRVGPRSSRGGARGTRPGQCSDHGGA